MEKERDLKNFINPKSIAIIGASNTKGKVGNILINKLKRFRGKVIPINPKHKKIIGKKSYPSVLDYKGKIDLGIIAIPAKFVNEVLEQCGKKGIKNIIVISAGFREIGKNKLEEQLISITRKYKMNLLGPNCFGVANPLINLDATFSNTSPSKGNIAFISQSGALESYIVDFPETKLSSFISVGNMADLCFSDWIEYFNKDSKTKAIILYMEKLKHGKKFIDICKKSKKLIIVIKAGKTPKGRQVTISHTASLATDYEIYKGAFKQARIKQATSLKSAFQFASMKYTISNKITILTNAGGAGALMADALIKKNLNVKESIDLLGTATAQDYSKSLSKLKKTKNTIVVILTPQKMSQPLQTAKEIIKYSKTIPIIAGFLGDYSTHKACNLLKKKGIPCFDEISDIADLLAIN